MTENQEDFDNAMHHLQTPAEAERLSLMVMKHLNEVRGFLALPDELQLEIAKRASELYGAGYVKGMRRRA